MIDYWGNSYVVKCDWGLGEVVVGTLGRDARIGGSGEDSDVFILYNFIYDYLVFDEDRASYKCNYNKFWGGNNSHYLILKCIDGFDL